MSICGIAAIPLCATTPAITSMQFSVAHNPGMHFYIITDPTLAISIPKYDVEPVGCFYVEYRVYVVASGALPVWLTHDQGPSSELRVSTTNYSY